MFTTKDRDICWRLYDRYYKGRKFCDAFYRAAIRRNISPGQRMLDAGCGRYLKVCKEFADTAEVVGIDLESVLETDNKSAPFGVRGDLGHLPFPSEYFDLVISRSVVEHLEEPRRVFSEFARVLKPGGRVVILTPNKYDYVSVIASITPYEVHRRLCAKIFQVSEDDVFPTLYRANTPKAIRKALGASGLIEVELETINHYPAYLMFSPVLFRLGVLYERLTSMKALWGLRGSILCVFRKATQEVARSAAERPSLKQHQGAGVEVH